MNVFSLINSDVIVFSIFLLLINSRVLKIKKLLNIMSQI